MCCGNKDEQTKTHVKNVMMIVFRSLKRESDEVEDCEGPGIWMTPSYVTFTDSESVISSKEIGRTVEESNVMDSISVVVFDTRLLRESIQTEIDFVNQLDVYKQTSNAVMTGMLEAHQLEYCSRLCEKDLKRTSFDVECATVDMMFRSVALRVR